MLDPTCDLLSDGLIVIALENELSSWSHWPTQSFVWRGAWPTRRSKVDLLEQMWNVIITGSTSHELHVTQSYNLLEYKPQMTWLRASAFASTLSVMSNQIFDFIWILACNQIFTYKRIFTSKLILQLSLYLLILLDPIKLLLIPRFDDVRAYLWSTSRRGLWRWLSWRMSVLTPEATRPIWSHVSQSAWPTGRSRIELSGGEGRELPIVYYELV